MIVLATHPNGTVVPGFGSSRSAAQESARKNLYHATGEQVYQPTYTLCSSWEAALAAMTDAPPRQVDTLAATRELLRANPELLTPKQAADELGVSPATVENRATAGKLTKLNGEVLLTSGKTVVKPFYLKAEVASATGASRE